MKDKKRKPQEELHLKTYCVRTKEDRIVKEFIIAQHYKIEAGTLRLFYRNSTAAEFPPGTWSYIIAVKFHY